MKKVFILTLLSLLLAPVAIGAWVKQPYHHEIGELKFAGLAKPDPERLKADVEKLAVTYATRHFGDVKTLDLAANYIQAELKKTTERVEIQSYQVDSEKFHNIIAHFGPKIDYTATYENGQPKPIIIGAHYDVHEDTMGADDNASGVAGLLELARIFAKKPPTIPVQIVAYTLEEPPNFRTDSMGSRQHAASLMLAGIQPELVMVLEMIGYYNEAENSQEYPVSLLKWFYPTRGDFIGVVGRFSAAPTNKMVKMVMQSAHPEFPVESISGPTMMTGIDFSDHASYWLHDMPAVMITDTSFYRNPNYHKATDTADTLDYTSMAKVVEGVHAVTVYMSDSKNIKDKSYE